MASQDSQFDFESPIERRGTGSVKWDRYKGRDILPLWVADMDFAAPPAVIEALQTRVAHGVFGYGNAPDGLLDAIQAHLLRVYGWQVRPDWIVWLPGLVPGLHLACRAVGEPGNAVLTLSPVYPPFLKAPAASDRRLIDVPLARDAQGYYSIDFERLEAAITPDTRLLLLCSPHNPVGRVYTEAELRQLAAFCERHDLTICSDEIHDGLVLDPSRRHIPLASLDAEIAKRSITLMAPSKTYNVPGLGFSFAVIPDAELRRRFRDAKAGTVPEVNALGFSAALAAYTQAQDWHAALLDYLRGNLARVTEAVDAMPGLSMGPVEATYLAWIDARAIAPTQAGRFFEQAGVGLSEGADFGAPGFVRLNFGCPRTTLDMALSRMSAATGCMK